MCIIRVSLEVRGSSKGCMLRNIASFSLSLGVV